MFWAGFGIGLSVGAFIGIVLICIFAIDNIDI